MCEEEPSPSTSSVPRNASIPIDQASSLDQPSSNHQSTVQSQEPSAQTQQQATESQKMHEEEHSRPLVGGETSSNHTLTSPGNQQTHTVINEGTANNQMSSVKNRNDLEAVQEITAVDLKPLVTVV
ncbi:unnamed protein product, partial [Anisakis simplex]|uniref:Uncharacterized protein n=1 Tax=Anisakis simplex TaxID=6269 RepID=A0A0M3KI09_ANISI